jgi:hypothetical protein
VSPTEHEFLITRGECRYPGDAYEEYCGCGMPDWPHAFIKVDGDLRAFVDHMNVEYIHMVYGDIVDALSEACRHLGIRSMVIR